MINELFFMRRALESISPGLTEKEMEPEHKIIIKILLFAYNHKNNNKFNYINKNKISLYESCLFLFFVARWMLFQVKYHTQNQKVDFDSYMISMLEIGFSELFNCKEILDTSINISRILLYDDITDDYFYENDKKSIIPAFEKFVNILKSDINNNQFVKFKIDSPTFVSRNFLDNMYCEIEAKYVLEMGLKIFLKELEEL